MSLKKKSENSQVEILVVEDSPTQAEQLRYILEMEGYQVTVARNGKEALSLLSEHRPTAVISDIVMPEMDGYQLCRQIKTDQALRSLPVILLTALSDSSDVVKALECGADNFLTKPYEEKYLLSRLQYFLINQELCRTDSIHMGLDIFFQGQKFLINSDRMQILNLLLSTYEAAVQKNSELTKVQEELRNLNEQLEKKIEQRTAELQAEIVERKQIEEALQRSEKEARQLAQENKTIAEIGQIISSTLNIGDVYERFAEEVHKLISFDRISINTINFEENGSTVLYVAGLDIRGRQPGDIIPLSGSMTETILRSRDGLLIQMEDKDEFVRKFPGLLAIFNSGLRSLMSVPLISKDVAIGMLHLQSVKPNAYSETDLTLAKRVGNQIVGAIANTQLFVERQRAETEKASLEEQLHQSQKMEGIGRLAGGIAHDFNNLLTIIKGYSQLSLMELKEDNPLKRNIEEIKNASDRASDLTRQLLAFSRRQVMELIVLDLNFVLRNFEKMLRRVIGEDIELVMHLGEDLGRSKADPGQIEQVIMNLAVNAKDAMPDGGKLTLETANVTLDKAYARSHVAVTPGPYVMLSMSDTGVGMSPEVRERVFEPFFTTKQQGQGTGLGLSTVYGIVKQSGGNIWVYSEHGKGTTFKIYLPRVDEPMEEHKEKVLKEALPRGSETVLVVEDEEKVRKVAIRILSEHGYKVLEAPQGSDVFLIAEEHQGPIDLLLTDVVMPKMSGREVAKRLSSIRPETKVLYMSGYTDNAIVHHGILDSDLNYIQKPFTIEGLTRKVREVLDK